MGRHGCRAAVAAALFALLLAVPSAYAAQEAGDAGDMPLTAQEAGPAGPLTAISGSIATADDRDMYKVCLTGGGTFSASTIGGAGFDSQLFLFDANGLGVYANDDAGGGISQSRLPAGHALTPQAAGVYYLAVSSFNWDPQSLGGRIFFSSGVAGPRPVGGLLPISGWAADDTRPGGAYTIALTGARSCIDATPPTVDLRTPPEGARYARDQQVLADYSCADEADGSGLDTCAGTVPDGDPIDTSTLGPHTFAVTATDKRGNQATVSHTYTVEDRTSPTVDLRTPPDDATYVRGAEVVADYSCADEAGGSGLASCSGTVPDGAAIDTSTLGDHSFTVTAADQAGNTTTVTHTYHVSDTTAPTVDLRTPADGGEYPLGVRTIADYSCADEAGGSGIRNCEGPVGDGEGFDTETLGPHTFTVTATDFAGNTSSVTHTYTVVDATPPAIDLRSPQDGVVYAMGQVVLADYDCDSGAAATCVGDVPDGAPLDTATAGDHTFTVHSTDAAGNESTETASYRVEEHPSLGFRGFLWPILNRPRVNVVQAGWILPMRFKLDGFRGRDVIAPGYPVSKQFACGTSVEAADGTPTAGLGHRHKLHFKRSGGWYSYLWASNRDWAGQCRQFVLKLSDGSYHRADFRFPARRRR